MEENEYKIKCEMLERVIGMMDKMNDRYHEYMLMNYEVQMKNNIKHDKNIGTNITIDTIIIQEYINENLKQIEKQKIFEYLEANELGLVSLVEHAVAPDKQNLQFQIQNSTHIKYKNENNEIMNETIHDFSNKVCIVIHDYCKPIIMEANDNIEENINNEDDDTILDALCQKNMTRVKNLQCFKFPETQVRLLKKVFSGLKAR